MSKRVVIDWDYTPEYHEILSEREYEQYTVHGTFVSEDSYDRDYAASIPLYSDPETGLFVSDIAAYEKWLKR